jgi:NAD(P)-dependent dehydrogenase (short-subunit alcohol dehydrogenase family)
MLLENKNAMIYGAGGSIGGAVARAFAREGRGSSLPVVSLRRSTRWPRRSALLAGWPRRRK